MACLILKGRYQCHQLQGVDPSQIISNLSFSEISQCLEFHLNCQIACDFQGTFDNHYLPNKLFFFLKIHPMVPLTIIASIPVTGPTLFTDASSSAKAEYWSENKQKIVLSPYASVQQSELFAIFLALQDFPCPFNIVSDSQYAVYTVSLLPFTHLPPSFSLQPTSFLPVTLMCCPVTYSPLPFTFFHHSCLFTFFSSS